MKSVVDVLKQCTNIDRSNYEVFQEDCSFRSALYIEKKQTVYYNRSVEFLDLHSIDLPLFAAIENQTIVDDKGNVLYQHPTTRGFQCVIGIHKRFVIAEYIDYYPSFNTRVNLYGLCENKKTLCLLDRLQVPTIRGYMYWAERNYLVLYTHEKDNLILQFENDKIEIVSQLNLSNMKDMMQPNTSCILPDFSFLQNASALLNLSLIPPLVQLVQHYLVFQL